jgi:hypothetical protein
MSNRDVALLVIGMLIGAAVMVLVVVYAVRKK